MLRHLRRRRVLPLTLLAALLAGPAPRVLAQPTAANAADARQERVRDLARGLAPQRREALAELLADREATLATLRRVAAAGDDGERRVAVEALGAMRDPGSLDVLVASTYDADVGVRRRGAEALRKLGDRAALRRLRSLATPDQERGLLEIALVGIGELGSSQDRPRVRPYLRHPDETVRVTAAGVLGMLGSDEGLDVLLVGSFSTHPGVRRNATYALGHLSAPEARLRLEEVRGDRDGPWRSEAAMGLILQELRGGDARSRATRLAAAASADRRVAAWALERLLGENTAEADAALARLAQAGGRIGERAAQQRALAGLR